MTDFSKTCVSPDLKASCVLTVQNMYYVVRLPIATNGVPRLFIRRRMIMLPMDKECEIWQVGKPSEEIARVAIAYDSVEDSCQVK